MNAAKLLAGAALVPLLTLAAQPTPRTAKPAENPNDPLVQRNDAYAKQLESHLIDWLVAKYPDRAAAA